MRVEGLLQAGRSAEALELVERSPDATYAWHTLRAGLLLLNGRPAQGWSALMRAFDLEPRAMSLYAEADGAPFVAGGAAQNNIVGSWHAVSRQQLVQALDACLARDPGEAASWAWRGLLRRSLGDYAGAAADLGRALELGPETARLLTWRGEALLQLGDTAGLEMLRRALTLPCQAWNHAWCGRAYVNFYKSREALPHLDRALELDPGNGWYHAWRGEARRLLGVREGMLEDFDRALTLDSSAPFRGWILTWRGQAALAAGRPDQAVADLSAALREMPGYALAHHARAQAHRQAGRWADWLEDQESACRLDAKYVHRLYSLAPEALEVLLAGLGALAPRAARWRGLVLALLGRREEARAALDAALAESPGDVWAAACRGQLRQQGGDADGALADLDAAAAADPRNALVLAWRALVHLEAGRSDAALADLDRSVALDARYAWVFSQRGCLRLLRGDSAAAAADFQRSLRIDPRDVNSRVDLAVALGRAGDAAAERRELERALAADAPRARDRLQVWAEHWEGCA